MQVSVEVYDRTLVIHVQLNPKPRQEQYRQYRDRLLQFQGDATELICLNWAKDVHEWSNGKPKPWNNIAGSAWYMKPNRFFDGRDATLAVNHQRGLYYTWLRPLRTHALFFNFDPAIFFLTASKVTHIGVAAAISRRRGPQLTKAYRWNNGTGGWDEQVAAEDGFALVVGEGGNAKNEIKRIADDNPFEAERILALCAGRISHTDDWYRLELLDSCVIDLSEVVQRITFAQDTDLHARDFRVARLKRCGRLWDILKTNPLPPALSDFQQGFSLGWSANSPHQNAISAKGERATVIYMGEEASMEQIEAKPNQHWTTSSVCPVNFPCTKCSTFSGTTRYVDRRSDCACRRSKLFVVS